MTEVGLSDQELPYGLTKENAKGAHCPAVSYIGGERIWTPRAITHLDSVSIGFSEYFCEYNLVKMEIVYQIQLAYFRVRLHRYSISYYSSSLQLIKCKCLPLSKSNRQKIDLVSIYK